MARISEYLTGEHRRCDDGLATAEEAAADERWDAASDAFESFATYTERHFEAEESVLFPRFEAVTGHSQGPTAIMREEHDEMRQLLAGMRHALGEREREDFLDGCETLLLMMQQHNLKEEDVLYPMSDEVLEAESEELLAAMRDLVGR
jgi:hemerythrin-like domain-containing protein